MQRRKLLALVLLGISATAAADFRTITEVYEVELDRLRLPGIDGGTLAFQVCDNCETQTLRVRKGTRYVLNERTTTLSKFKVALDSAAHREDVIVDVYHHLDSNTVTDVKVRL